ncbi:MAG: hypothetical protein P8Z37_17140 [Acidobacteriota bacterium]
MASKILAFVFALLLCLLLSITQLVAQSMDKDNPTPLQSAEIGGISNAVRDAYWYKFTAGPGKLIIDMEVQCWDGRQCVSTVDLVLYDEAMTEVVNESLTTGSSYTLRSKNVPIELDSNQVFLMSIRNGRRISSNAYGTYVIRFKGAIDLPGSDRPEKDRPEKS